MRNEKLTFRRTRETSIVGARELPRELRSLVNNSLGTLNPIKYHGYSTSMFPFLRTLQKPTSREFVFRYKEKQKPPFTKVYKEDLNLQH